MTEKMKPSGFDYLGNIPASWDAKRFKYCVQICNGGEYADIEVEEGGYPVIGSGGEFARASKYCYRGESVLLGRKGTVDKPLYVNDAFWCVDTMFYTKAKAGMVPKFLYYCALGFRFDYYVTATALPSMTQKDLGSEMIAVPPTDEQHAIADYLDVQCTKIDSVIADIEEQIETLQKYKKSMITEAVTKGLDHSVPMKNSGMKNVGDIPQGWSVQRLKYVSRLKTGTTPAGNEGINYEGQGIPWFTPSDFVPSLELEKSEKFVDDETINREGITPYPANSVLLVAIGATVGKIGITKSRGYSNQQITAIIPTGIDSKYLLYYLFSKADYIKDNALYTTLPIINNAYLSNIPVIIPSEQEQKDIAEYLNRRCSLISKIICDKEKQLKTVQQHKKSLICEYVTGKKRVTEVN